MRAICCRTRRSGEATVEFDSANGDLVVDYRLGRDVEEPATIPEIFVFGPDGFQKPIAVKKIAAGTFRGRLQIGDRARDCSAYVRWRNRARFPEAGSVSARKRSWRIIGSNEALLKQVAEFTGGRFQPDPKDVFDAGAAALSRPPCSCGRGYLALAIVAESDRSWSCASGRA